MAKQSLAEPTETPAPAKAAPGKKKEAVSPGVHRAAQLLIALGAEAAAAISGHLSDSELEDISAEIVALGSISPGDKRTVIKEFYATAMAREYIAQGGEDYAREMLINSLGERKAKAIMARFRGMTDSSAFAMLSNVDAPSITNFLKKEHPQTIALVLSSLSTSQAAQILTQLPEDVRTTVAYRMATIERPSAEVIGEIRGVLGDYIDTNFQDMSMKFGGTTHVAETFNEIEQSVWKGILDEIEEEDPKIAEEIKTQMFTFADLVLLDNKSIQSVLKEVDSKDLALALKGAGAEVKDLIFRNMSKRAMTAIKEEMEYMGAVRVSEVEGAQARIIEVVRNLDAEGAIYIEGRGGGKQDGLIE